MIDEDEAIRHTRDADLPLAEAITVEMDSAGIALEHGDPSFFDGRVTPVTAKLLDWWFSPDAHALRPINFHAGQRDAILATIFSHEIRASESLPDLYDKVKRDWRSSPRVNVSEVENEHNDHAKYCIKMATGTGKTWVMNALLIWQYLNAVAAPDDRRFTRNFLIIAPGIIVYNRLLDSFLGKVDPSTGERDYRTSDIASNEQLFLPDQYRDAVHAFVQGSTLPKERIGNNPTSGGVIAITNWHLLAGKDTDRPDFLPESLLHDVDNDPTDTPADAKTAAESFLPLTAIQLSGRSLDQLDAKLDRGQAFDWLRDLAGGLLVFNDEAHHIHSIKRGESIDAVEWQKALDALAAPRREARKFTQIDFTATPFVESGGKKKHRKYFPHIITDFDLHAAIAQGLVKSIALDRRTEIASIANEDLEFRTDRDDEGRRTVSDGQATMLRAGLEKLSLLERDFAPIDPEKHPKLLILTEDTAASKAVEEFLQASEGIDPKDLLRIDSDRKGDVSEKEWLRIRDRLFGLDHAAHPRIVISVLMLREGFDVNSICVIVPLRAAQSGILLEQVIGRGLRLMWRDNPDIDAAKAETRRRIREHREPDNRYDLLSIVEHPAFLEWYERELGDGLFQEETDSSDHSSTSDIELISLRDDWQRFDIPVPFIVHDASSELSEPRIDIDELDTSKYPFDDVKRLSGHEEHWQSEDLEEKTRFGDYRVAGGLFTATGYNDYLARMAKRLSTMLAHAFMSSPKTAKEASEFPVLQISHAQLIGWIDAYIRTRMFGEAIDPLADDNWRVLLRREVAEEIVGVFGPALFEQLQRTTRQTPEVFYRSPAEVHAFRASASRLIATGKCIYPKLRIAPTGGGGGLERAFVESAEQEGSIEAYVKLDEHLHDYLQRPYLKSNGNPARYSPDFLVRTADTVYVVETKSATGLRDVDVARKRNAALAWVNRIDELPLDDREDRVWRYVLLNEDAFYTGRGQHESLPRILDFASLHSGLDDNQRLPGL